MSAATEPSPEPRTSANSVSRPLPEPDETSRFFWEGARAGQLLVQRCRACGKFQYPPDVVCIHCQSTEIEPAPVSGRGSLYSYSVVDRPYHAGFVDLVPYVVALVELDEQPGLKLLTNVVDADTDELAVGMPLEVTFDPQGDIALPQFRPARDERTGGRA